MDSSHIFSAGGELFLFAAYVLVTLFHKERFSMALSAIGSVLMAISFYLVGGYSFLFLNVLWFVFSVHGFLKRGNIEYACIALSPSLGRILLIGVSVPTVCATLVGSFEMASWGAVGIYLLAFVLFASEMISRQGYILASVFGSLCSIPYILELGNYPSLVHTILNVAISLYSLARDFRSAPKCEVTEAKS